MRTTLLAAGICALSCGPASAQQASTPTVLEVSTRTARSTQDLAPALLSPKLSAAHLQGSLAGLSNVDFDNSARLGSGDPATAFRAFGDFKPRPPLERKPAAPYRGSFAGAPVDQAPLVAAKKPYPLDAATFVSPAAGVLFTRLLYSGKKDKYLHSYAGAGISIASSLAGSWLVSRTDYSPKTQRVLVKLIGPAAGLAAGLLKEYVYDAARRDRHTVDFHDALATGLGAGIVPLSLIFEF